MATADMVEVNVWGIVYLAKIAIYYVLLWKEKIIAEKVRGIHLLLKIFAFSLFLYPALAFIPVLAFRTSELFGEVEILLIPCLFYCVRPRPVGKLIVICYAAALLGINLFYNKFLEIG